MKSIHIIGATGHIGSYLCPVLLEAGYKVTGYSRGEKLLDSIAENDTNYKHIIANRSEAIDLALKKNADVICDLVCYTVKDAKELCEKLYKVRAQKNTKIVSIGSIWVYGDKHPVLVDEQSLKNADDEYGKNKGLMEKYLLEQHNKNHLNVTVVHPGHVCGQNWLPVGPQGNKDSTVFEKIKNGEKIFLPDGGDFYLQHVHSIDVSRLIKAVIENDKSNGEAFNVACDQPISLKDYATLIYKYYNKDPLIEYLEYEDFLSSLDPYHSKISKEHIDKSPNVSVNKAKQILNFSPIYSEKDIIIECLNNLEKEKLITSAKKFRNQWNDPVENYHNHLKISVIIPLYEPEHLNVLITQLIKINEFHEIILVDDSGNINSSIYEDLEKHDNIKIFYHSCNLGRSAARNTGAVQATGDLFLFLDQDMILSPHFIEDAKRYHEVNSSMIFLGLRETVPYKKIPLFDKWISPSINADWRICTKVKSEFDDLTVLEVGSTHNNCKPNMILEIYKSTDGLRNIGVSSKDTIGFWDLPSMVVSHTLLVSKNDFFRIGGFAEWIKGWGGEDIVFGFLACAAKIPIILSEVPSYQIEHKPYSGSHERKVKELNKNLLYYREWAKKLEDFPQLNYEETVKRGILYSKSIENN